MIKLKMKTKISAGYNIPVESIVNALVMAMMNLADDDTNDNINVPSQRDILERLDTKTCEQFAKRDLEILLDDELSEDGRIDADYLNAYKTLRKLNLISAKVYKQCKQDYE